MQVYCKTRENHGHFFLLHPVLQKAVNNKTLSAQAFIINLATYVGNNIQDGYTDIFWG